MFIALGVMFYSGIGAQNLAKVDSVFLKNWMHSDFSSTGIYGVNTLKAKDFLKEKKRKPASIVVAVLDSGVEYFHQDLEKNMWVNTKEQKKQDGKDSDKNGYVDDIYGWNFVVDVNNKNYQYDSYESVREYRRLSDFFRAKSHLVKNKELHQQYLKLKKSYYENQSRHHWNKISTQRKIEYFKPRLEALNKAWEEKIVNQESFKNFLTEDTLALEGLVIFRELLRAEWEGKTMKQITASYLDKLEKIKKNADNQLEYSYNINYDPRQGQGKIYGNADVKALADEHGTHVAGIIAADWENDKGIKGTGGGNYVKIMGVRVVPDGDERDIDVANGIRYAVDNGAKILNMSFGKSHSSDAKLVQDAFKYAESKNVLIVKAAGNDNTNIDERTQYPTTFIGGVQVSPTTITVGASTRHKENLKARFSNYGQKSVDLFAPGMEIYSAVPGKDKYEFFNGTSMASPAAAGVAAMVWSHYPKLSASDIKNILMQSVNKNDQLKNISVSGGVVDAYQAVQKAEEIYKNRKLK